MKLPEPTAWVHKTDFGRLMFSSSPTVPPWSFPVFTEAQLRELLSKQEALMHRAFDALYFSTPIGVKPCKQNADALEALKRALNKH